MNIRRKWFAAFLALLLLLSAAGTVSADENEDTADYIQQIINYYYHHQDAAKTDIDCLIYELSEIDLEQAQAWASIMDYWAYVNDDMTLYPGVLPDGLPQSDSLCIVVLGYELTADGSMKKELIGRLETALASAEKYPNAYIACTGGSTARNNPTATEAGKMAQWLTEHGITEERIIVEDQSYSTVDNAANTCRMLAQDYPQITHLALVTSDYHLPRACLLFHAQATLAANAGAPLLCIAANAAFETDRDSEDFEMQVGNLMQLTRISIDDMPKPELSKLDCILVTGSAQCIAGKELNLKVVAYYDTGLYRDVTNRVKYSGVDLAAAGMQDVTITYEEDGIEVSSTVEIEMLAPETEPPTEPPTEAPTEPPATEPKPESDNSGSWLTLPLTIIGLLVVAEVLIILRLIKIKKLLKAAKKAEEEEAAPKLPDDDSPVEYI